MKRGIPEFPYWNQRSGFLWFHPKTLTRILMVAIHSESIAAYREPGLPFGRFPPASLLLETNYDSGV